MLIVNPDTHRPLVLLPGRDQRTLATWFRKYPEIQVVSRDRSGVYATAAREGAPQARQVADRWHLLKNIGDEPERMMYRYMPLIGTCRLNNVEPEKWLRYVIEHIQDWPANRVRDLLPWKVDLSSQ